MRVTCRAANRTSPWMGLTRPEAFESFSSRFCRTAAAAASSKSLASILIMPSICNHHTVHCRNTTKHIAHLIVRTWLSKAAVKLM